MCSTSEDRDTIVLIGFMGAGKSTVGSELRRLAGYRLIDLDQLIVERFGRSIAELFAVEGEDFFRDLETEVLGTLAGVERAVVATGGGIVGRPENWERMRRLGPIVFLDCRWETLQRRLGGATGRPLAVDRDWERIEALWRQRLPLYRQADLMVEADGRTPRQVAQEILERIGKERTGWNG